MISPDTRTNDRTVHYTMKTPRQGTTSSGSHSYSQGHSHSNSQAHRSNWSGTPLASPRMSHSAGQAYPPKRSPGAGSRVSTQVQDVRSPSPNYFGLIVEPATDVRDSTALPRSNWSPPTSSIKSFVAAIPQQLPLDANPDFEAFKRQADANRGGSGFRLSAAHVAAQIQITGTPLDGGPPAAPRPRVARWHTHESDSASEMSIPRPAGAAAAASRLRDSMDVDTESNSKSNSIHDSAYVSADSKRNSQASLNPAPFLNLPRRESPAQFEPSNEPRTGVSNVEDRHPRLSVMQGKAGGSASGAITGRADTEPARLEAGVPKMLGPTELRDILESPAAEGLLLLDVRVATHYAASRIQGALNLCIPTTLLKRATFNLHKLQQTFQSDEQQAAFSAWRDKAYLVVYDSSSADKRDAVAAMNMLKKFTNEGYTGKARVLRGGFNALATSYPHLVDRRSSAELSRPSALSLNSQGHRRPALPPVLGGVALPKSSGTPDPFFANIRQNVDLADGVGQMDIAVPANINVAALPQWLRAAADDGDRGRAVSDMFLHIEQAEQTRMKNVYSAFNASGNNAQAADSIQLSGIEKGVKNRYKDILPFEHARVKLEGRPEGDCDYVNASHIKATRSNKRYIASQGPLPATFDDFWSVVWDQDVRVVVMLTAESEGGQLKCHPYWKGKEYGAIRLRLLSEKKVSLDVDKHRSHSTITDLPPDANAGRNPSSPSAGETGRRRANTTTTLEGTTPAPAQPRQNSSTSPSETPFVVIRKFALSHAAHPFAPIREITHLHYPSWPDFGAPAQPAHLLALVELANVMHRAALPADMPYGRMPGASASDPHLGGARPPARTTSSLARQAVAASPVWYDQPEADVQARPMLVHCSAGCGRTGTFCAVDSVLDMLKRQRSRDVRAANAAAASRRPPRDDDGDVAMLEDDPVSPLTARQESSAAAAGPMDVDAGADDAGAAGLDTAFLDDDSVDLVARTVEDFRGQRLSMVQSLRQFVLCYETVLEYLWRIQDRSAGPSAAAAGTGGRTRARSGSLQVGRTNS